LRYANNPQYKRDTSTRKQVYCGPAVIAELRRIIREARIVDADDAKWPEADRVGSQELEVVLGADHICFRTTKIGSLLDVQASEDPEGLRTFYYLVQDLRCLVFSLIGLHFKIKPT